MMPNSPPPPNDDRNTFDEWVAAVVALVAIGSVLFWSIGRQNWRAALNQPMLPSLFTDEVSEPTAALPPTTSTADEVERRSDRRRVEPDAASVESRGSRVPMTQMAPSVLALLESDALVSDDRPEMRPGESAPTAEELLPESLTAVDGDQPEETLETAENAADAIAEDAQEPSNGAVEEPTQPRQVRFADVPDGHWAKPFIDNMGELNALQGVDGEFFQPDEPITRAQYAALVAEVFARSDRQISVSFGDIADDYWARSAIDAAVRTGFLNGYPNQVFRPDEPITRMQVLLSLNSGLELPPSTLPTEDVLNLYRDRQQIPEWAVPAIAAVTEASLVVSPENETTLSPDRPATRAEVVSMVYQALVQQGEAEALDSPYVVTP